MLIQRGNYFIADIRADASAGVPALRRGARGKGARVPLRPLGAALAEEVVDAGALENALVALRARAAAPAGAKVVFMGDSGVQDAAVAARALKKLGGRRALALMGGFEAWREKGLLTAPAYTTGGVEGALEEAKESYAVAAALTQATLVEIAQQTMQSLMTADEAVRSVAALPVPAAAPAPEAQAAAAPSAAAAAGDASAPAAVLAKEEAVVA